MLVHYSSGGGGGAGAGGAAGGVLGGTYPDPTFAVDMATQAELDARVDGAAWDSWVPAWTNLTVGNGTQEAKFKRIGKTVVARLALIFGSTTSITGAPVFTLPATAVSGVDPGLNFPLGHVMFLDNGTNNFQGQCVLTSDKASARLQSLRTDGVVGSQQQIASASPFVWTTLDCIHVNMTYEGV